MSHCHSLPPTLGLLVILISTFQVFSPGLRLVFLTVVGLAHSRFIQRRQLSDGYGAPAAPVITAGPSQPIPAQPKPSYNAPGGGGGGKFNIGLPSFPKPDLSGLFGKLKNPFGALKGGLKLPSFPGKPSGGGRPKPTYGSSSPGIGLPSFPKPSLPSLPKPDLSGIKNIFSGIIAAKKVCVGTCGTVSYF